MNEPMMLPQFEMENDPNTQHEAQSEDWVHFSRKRHGKRTQDQRDIEPTVLHPLFIVADAVVAHIHDYPTLICLAMTCWTFHELVHNSETVLPIAFDHLERWRPYDGGPGSEHIDIERRVYLPPSATYRGVMDRFGNMVKRTATLEECQHYDIFRFGVGQLLTMEWRVCYGCMSIQRAATHFFINQRHGLGDLLGAQALDRRCITCDIGTRYVGRWSGKMMYLEDMPRGIQGYRLRCAECHRFEWVTKRPRGKQKKLKLCRMCFERWLGR